jgi:hypothetical protein
MKTPNFKFTPAKSSNIAATAYDQATQSMAVTFKSGKTYQYADVPQELYTSMGKADSIGNFISSNIVGKFKHSTLGN